MAGNEPVSSSKNANTMAEEKQELPSPALKKSGEENEDDPAKNQGRVRAVTPDRGSWWGFAYIDYSDTDGFMEIQFLFLTKLRTITKLCFETIPNIHVGLTKTILIPCNKTIPFFSRLESQLLPIRRFRVDYDDVHVYVNEKRTRTYVGLRVAKRSYPALNKIISQLDVLMREYQQPEFHKDPTYHVNLAWTAGDRVEIISQYLSHLEPIFLRIYDEDYTDMTKAIQKVKFNYGYKVYTVIID